ncbi:TMV resistance protein N-like isoform X1 [Punica granatum]|uniref:TMV resistance protein N-like isoform X1 n=2 Tax=Punica granatum TaxID=22663 RepID=A0A6P8EJV0_PUNGR|nr:TMV resistance protein N-like isoform X1 [Punica granatum]
MATEFGDSVSNKRGRDNASCSVFHKKWRHDVSGSYSHKGLTYDVFLSFRGEDTRHLFHCLEEKGVNAFIDNSLLRGEDISSQLIDTIRSSRISVVVLSRNYANSSWCLEELSEIMECRNKSIGQMVLPVFYDVDPSDVRKQTSCYGEAFAKHEAVKDKETVARWRAALTEVASLFGWDLTNYASGTEAKIVKKIAHRICNELNNAYLDVAKDPVGLRSRMIHINDHLNDPSDYVLFIVICGMGGIGKTTLAKAVFNQFFHSFEAKCFLANIRENSEQPNGLVHLQEQLLHDILRFQKIEVVNIDRGINVIKERLKSRRVLVVLDDVSHRDQLKALAREREWFGPGSRIIITTRDQDSVKEINANCIYKLPLLNNHESGQLFKQYAFRNCDPSEEFFELAKAVVSYCEGLPLALEVLGSYLLELSVEDWKSALHQLGRNPHSDIQMKLEISYHALGSEDDKKLFLDIACFFVGWDKNLVVKVLEACDLCVGLGLDVLSRRSLVKITKKNKLEMHDMIRDMGREIVRRESPQNPGKRSRLFSLNDILATLRNHSGTEQVEGLVSNYYLELAEKLDAKAFERMRLLRLLELNNLHVDGDFGLISKELRWLCWHGFPLDFLPDELYMENLVVLDMQYSKLRSTWKTNSKEMPRLRVLNLSYSHFLTKTPDFSGLSKLEELIMEDCKELKEIDRSIGCLKGLLLMNLKDCEKLKSIPDSICKVRTLQILDIRGCSNLMRLPDDFGNLESLTELLADGAPIMQSPLSFANLKNLSKLSLWGYSRQRSSSISALVWSWISRREAPKENNCLIASVCGLRSLTELRLINCNILDDANLDGIGSLQNLIQFEISGSHIRCLPGSISSLSNLQIFTVNYCPKLESLPDLPQKIIAVRAIGCQSLERISLPNSPVETGMCFWDCPRLAEISHSGVLNPFFLLSFKGCNKQLSAKLNELILKSWRGRELFVSGSNIPEWFEYQSTGPSIFFQLPACHSCKLNRIFVSYIICNHHATNSMIGHSRLFNTTRGKSKWSCLGYLPPFTNHISIFSISPEEIMEVYEGIEVVLDVEPHPHLITRAIGIHLEVEKCPSCSGIYIDDVEAGPSHGNSHDKYPHETETKPTTEITAVEQWLLRYCPV